MVNKISLILLIILSVGCGRQSPDFQSIERLPYWDNSVSPELAEFVDSFETKFDKQISFGVLIVDELNDYKNGGLLDDNVIGVCWKSYDGSERVVEIKRDSFIGMSKYRQEELIYHELGHCKLNRMHKESYFDNRCPTSIMNPYIFSEQEITNCYTYDEPSYKYYMDELNKIY